MKTRRLLCNAEQVRAFERGATRFVRPVKPQPYWIEHSGRWCWPIPKRARKHGCAPECVTASREWHAYMPSGCCPYGVPGDRLWIAETFQPLWFDEDIEATRDYKTGEGYEISYPATDGIQDWHDFATDSLSTACKPSTNMPRWASRSMQLPGWMPEVVDVAVCRLRDIDEESARMSPGIGLGDWVWAVTFRRTDA